MKEEWKDIPGYNGTYQVSNYGYVRSWNNNRWGMNDSPKILSPNINHRGNYKRCMIQLFKEAGGKRYYIHRLVACAFLPNPMNKPEVNHKDSNAENNHISNLEWCTRKENMGHASKNGRIKVPRLMGESHASSKLTNSDVMGIRKMSEDGESIVGIAKKYNISRGNVRFIIERKTWCHV